MTRAAGDNAHWALLAVMAAVLAFVGALASSTYEERESWEQPIAKTFVVLLVLFVIACLVREIAC